MSSPEQPQNTQNQPERNTHAEFVDMTEAINLHRERDSAQSRIDGERRASVLEGLNNSPDIRPDNRPDNAATHTPEDAHGHESHHDEKGGIGKGAKVVSKSTLVAGSVVLGFIPAGAWFTFRTWLGNLFNVDTTHKKSTPSHSAHEAKEHKKGH